MKSIFGEFSRNLKAYSFYIHLNSDEEQRVVLTPEPERLYIGINDFTIIVKLLAPIIQTDDCICEKKGKWIYIRASSEADIGVEIRDRVEYDMDIEFLRCRNCDNEFANNINKTLALPSTNWEILSELWSCHPSHEPPISLQLRPNICYIGLFYCHIQGSSVIEDSLIQSRGFYSCKNCGVVLGYTALDSNIFFRHKISPNLISMDELLEEALIERINEANRDIVIGNLEIRLLKWDSFIFIRGSFEAGYQILYRQTQNKGLVVPEEDITKIKESLENINKLLPKAKRNYFDWKVSYLISKRIK